ncbi:hypothetical protein BCAH1134_C0421 (plasmid) [Bacillus cereus AH1134]|nr:hypothetical protein BCAH1134_C0421 [Bacillus cereus AH1134]
MTRIDCQQISKNSIVGDGRVGKYQYISITINLDCYHYAYLFEGF